MHFRTAAVLGGLAAVAAAAPHQATGNIVKRAVSPNNTCGYTETGAGNNYTCGTSNSGPCCSQHGWCGSTVDYCGTGCQPEWGTCSTANASATVGAGGDSLPGNTVTTTSSPGKISTNNQCGPANDNTVCPAPLCCSPSGWCGASEEYCESPDCLLGYGVCDADTVPDGQSTENIPRPELGKVVYGDSIYDCSVPGTIALTFDDGPYIYTSELLDLLHAYGVKATFFITGINLGKGSIANESLAWPGIIRRMYDNGHQVASHTWSHANLTALNDTQREQEMIKNEMAFRNIFGKFPTYMRPPYSECEGGACKATMKKLGYHITYFDLDTQDYLHTTPDTYNQSTAIIDQYLSSADPKTKDFLAIEHDIHQQTVRNLTGYFLDQMVKHGFKAVPVGTCLDDPAANWYRDAGNSSSNATVSTSTSAASTSTSTPKPTLTSSSSTTTSSSQTATSSSQTPTSATTTAAAAATKSSSSSSSSIKPPSSSSSSSAKASTAAAVAPTPTPSCGTYKVGTWCAPPLQTFTSKTGCLTADAVCSAQTAACVMTRGNTAKSCKAYTTDVCDKLAAYCGKCSFGAGKCLSSGFVF